MMNLKSFVAAVALGLSTVGGTAQAQDKGTERPNVKVGAEITRRHTRKLPKMLHSRPKRAVRSGRRSERAPRVACQP